jgi:hypothetical protein
MSFFKLDYYMPEGYWIYTFCEYYGVLLLSLTDRQKQKCTKSFIIQQHDFHAGIPQITTDFPVALLITRRLNHKLLDFNRN